MRKIGKILAIVALVSIISLTSFSLVNAGSIDFASNFSGKIVVGEGSSSETGTSETSTGGLTVPNPLEAESLTELANNVLEGLWTFAIPVAAIMFTWGGILIFTSRGNEEQVKKGRKAVAWTAIGLAILLVSQGLVSVVTNFIGADSPTGGMDDGATRVCETKTCSFVTGEEANCASYQDLVNEAMQGSLEEGESCETCSFELTPAPSPDVANLISKDNCTTN